MDDFGPRSANLARVFVLWAASIAVLEEIGFFGSPDVPYIFYMQAVLGLVAFVLVLVTARDVSRIRTHCRDWLDVLLLCLYLLLEGMTAGVLVKAAMRQSVDFLIAFIAMYLTLLVVGMVGPSVITLHVAYVEKRLCGATEEQQPNKNDER